MNITSGIFNGRKIIAPNPKITRPTLSKTRMSVFNTLASIMGTFEDKSFLDVFGGSGIMGLEAISRGFSEVKVYELNKKTAEIIVKNYYSLGLKPNLLMGDSRVLIRKEEKIFDVVYIDPPYDSDLYDKIIPYANGNILVVESDSYIDLTNYNVLKQKKYGSTIISFIKK